MNTISQERDTRLDLAKAIAITLVMIWHLQPIRISVSNNSSFIIQGLKFGVEQFYYQVTLLAVPLFFLVSSYLFFERMGDRVLVYAKKRLSRISVLFVFWTAIQFLVYFVIKLNEVLAAGKVNLGMSLTAPELIMRGGPALPYVGGSIYYFLFVLLGVIFLSAVIGLLKDQKIVGILCLSAILVSLAYFEIGGNLSYWRMDNFLIYAPISYFLWKDQKDQKAIFIPLLFIGYALFSTHDQFLRQAGYNLEGYSRLSVVFGATALFSSILQFKNVPENKLASFLSRYSLGIFATHKFWQLLVMSGFVYSGIYSPGSDPAYALNVWDLLISMLVFGLTFGLIWLLRNSPFKKFIS